MGSASYGVVLAVAMGTGVSGCCDGRCRQARSDAVRPVPPPPPASPTQAPDRTPVVEPHGVVAVTGPRQDMTWIRRGSELLQERGIDSFVLLGIGVKLIVDSEHRDAARSILRADPVCGHLELPVTAP